MTWLTEKLGELIASRALSTASVARDLGIERSRLARFLEGAAAPNESLTRRLAAYFGEDPDDWISSAAGTSDAARQPSSVPTDFIKVARASDLAEGDMLIVWNNLVVVARADDQFWAFGNVCPHAKGPIGEGFLDDCVVECPWHAGRWDVRTGKALTMLATADIPLFPTRVVGDDIEILLNAAVLGQGTLSTSPDAAG
jgi:nitrite reductase/ring-hydroxylating ferredoxin subunit